jgi:uroporphyrinogen-III synthase
MATDRGCVWVTRTEPGAGRLAARLDDAGYRVVKQPLLRIEGCPETELNPLAQQASSFDLIIATSVHAVNFAAPLILDQGGLLDQVGLLDQGGAAPRWIAVGQQTAEALLEYGVHAEVPEAESSEGILSSVGSDELSGRRVLLLCGIGGRQLLVKQLDHRGAEVVRLESYRRLPVVFSADALAELTAVDVALIASAEAGAALAQVLPMAAQRRLRLVAGSTRIASALAELGFNAVVVAEGPGDDAMLAALDGALADSDS